MQSAIDQARDDLNAASERLADALLRHRRRVVFAESCTAGLIAASLSRVPGVSEWMCGSMVVYRNPTKSAWLGIAAEQLDDPGLGPVCEATARGMIAGVLSATPEADFAAAVTGHLGPRSPADLDGVVYCACGGRAGGLSLPEAVQVRRLELTPPVPEADDVALRWWRQLRAAEATMQLLTGTIHAANH